MKFFLYTLAGSAFMLVGMLALVFLHQRATGVLTFDLVKLAEHARWPSRPPAGSSWPSPWPSP